MKVLAVHPSGLMYTRIFLKLEPLGLELIAAACRNAGHAVRLVDLQVESQKAFFDELREWRPDALCFSCNYLANIPEIVDLSKAAKVILPGCFVFVGGHSASFTSEEILRHAGGAIDCVLRGEGEASVAALLDAAHDKSLGHVPGAVTLGERGPSPHFVEDLDALRPARDLLRHPKRYYIGALDPCGSIEFSRGCPWDCTFCSAWTFYGRSYRRKKPERIAEELAGLRAPGAFIVDDVAFVQAAHGMAIADAIEKRRVKKKYYLETRGDVLLRNKEVFRRWRGMGLEYMFLGLEAIDEEGLKKFRKRTSLGANFEALDFARSLDIAVAVNIIVDPDWDRARFAALREWCLEIPEIVNISVNTPYPGTEIWHSERRKLVSRDYRLFDIQHAVMPTKLPLAEFYSELVKTQQILNRKHLGWSALKDVAFMAADRLLHGQTNFIRMLFNFNSVFDPELQLADHRRAVRYEMAPPPQGVAGQIDPKSLYIHPPAGRRGRHIDDDTERFVDETRMGAISAAPS
jgi:hopanoid C-3 methylase HpnR